MGSDMMLNTCMGSPDCVYVPCSSDHIIPGGSEQQVKACSRLQTPTPRDRAQNTGRKLQPFVEKLQLVVISSNKVVILSVTGPKIGYDFGERRKTFILLLGSFSASQLHSVFQNIINKPCWQWMAANAQLEGN